MTCVFSTFAACDIADVFPPFDVFVIVAGQLCSREDAVGSWRWHNAPGDAHCTAGTARQQHVGCFFCNEGSCLAGDDANHADTRHANGTRTLHVAIVTPLV